MKLLLKFLCISFSISLITAQGVFAARVYMEAPNEAKSTREPFILTVYLDTEKEIVSGIAGTLTFPTELFEVEDISTKGGVVSMWASSPKIPEEKYFDGRTHITFEGIMPGGFEGVRSPYYDGVRPGGVFSVKLIPKNKGSGNFILENIELHAFDENGSLIPSGGSIKVVTVPALVVDMPKVSQDTSRIYSSTLTASIARSELIARNAWYVTVHEDSTINSVDHVEIAESSYYDPEDVPLFLWRTATTPYVLLYQSRSKYVHVKVVYTNKTYALQTLPPVENSSNIFNLSRILVGIIISTLLFFRYGKNILHIVSKYKHRRT